MNLNERPTDRPRGNLMLGVLVLLPPTPSLMLLLLLIHEWKKKGVNEALCNNLGPSGLRGLKFMAGMGGVGCRVGRPNVCSDIHKREVAYA